MATTIPAISRVSSFSASTGSATSVRGRNRHHWHPLTVHANLLRKDSHEDIARAAGVIVRGHDDHAVPLVLQRLLRQGSGLLPWCSRRCAISRTILSLGTPRSIRSCSINSAMPA